MGGFVGVLVGLSLAVFGFMVMRNPMRLALLSPGAGGYYQRMVLDTTMRNQLCVLGGASVFVRIRHPHGFVGCNAQGSCSSCHIRRTLGVHGVDILCCVVLGIGSTYLATSKTTGA
jgi:hypothetical protein